MKKLMLVPVLVTALLAGLAIATVTADTGTDHVDRDKLEAWARVVATEHGTGDLPQMIPNLVIMLLMEQSIDQVGRIGDELERYLLGRCSELIGQAAADCLTAAITGGAFADAVSHVYNYDISTYRTATERATIPPGTIQLFAGTLTPRMLTETFTELMLRGAEGVRPQLELARFERCQNKVSNAIGGTVGDENSGDIIHNCTDIRHTSIDPTAQGRTVERKNILDRQLAWLEAVDPGVLVIVQEYCDVDINRTPAHYEQDAQDVRPVFDLDVKRCSIFFVGDQYAALRAGWLQSYDTYQAWAEASAKNRHAPTRRPVINGAVQLAHVAVQQRDPTPADPGDGMTGPNTPPRITEISPHNSNVPVEQTPDYEFDKDGYALVEGGLVHRYTPQNATGVKCVFYGYDGARYEYTSCP